jgi:hypothetical protein
MLAKQSWTILRADRTLALFTVISALATTLAAIVLLGPGAVLYFTKASKAAGIALGVLGAYAVTFVALYCNTALAAAAGEALDGRPATVSGGFAVARTRRATIAQWALVQLTVGLLLQALQGLLSNTPAGRLVGVLVRSLVGAAWAIVTFFVVPVLALEGLGPRAALERSAHVIRARWGEGLVGSGSIGLVVMLLGMLPAIALVVLAVVLLVVATVVGSTLSAIFRVALFRFATSPGDAALGGFDRDALDGAFRRKRQRR